MIIIGERVYFKTTSIDDIDYIIKNELDPENSDFVLNWSKEKHLDSLNDENICRFTIYSKNDERIGFIILCGYKDKKVIEFKRFVISQKGQGYGKEAMQVCINFVFEELKAHKMWLDVLESNEIGIHLYKSCGFKEEAKLIDHDYYKGKYQSWFIMSIIK